MEQPETNTLAVIGAGPIGLETALYARFLGFDVTVFEAGNVCEHVENWSHVQLFTPFKMNCSPLGIEAIKAQNPKFDFLPEDELHTGRQWIDQYLKPLAETDLLRSNIRTNCLVISIGREYQSKNENVGKPERNDYPFRLLVSDDRPEDNSTDNSSPKNGAKESYHSFDYVIDTSGTFGQANFLGSGGLPAIGEKSIRQNLANPNFKVFNFSYSIPDLKADDIHGKTILVVGSGYSAATNIVNIGKLIERGATAKVIWLTRKKHDELPLKTVDNDPLVARNDLSQMANQFATSHGDFQWKQGAVVAIREIDRRYQVDLEAADQEGVTETLEVDLVLANVGFQGDFAMLSELQVHRCYATDGPMKWAASMMAQQNADCMSQSSEGSEKLRTTEPDFYVLGSKLYGRDPRFLFSLGLRQIRDVFQLIVERDSLDLYQSMTIPQISQADRP